MCIRDRWLTSICIERLDFFNELWFVVDYGWPKDGSHNNLSEVNIVLLSVLTWLVCFFCMMGCVWNIYSLVYAQSTGSAQCSTSCSCPVNLCLDNVTAIQLHPDFTWIYDQTNCSENDGATMYVHNFDCLTMNHTNTIQYVCCCEGKPYQPYSSECQWKLLNMHQWRFS